MDWIQGQKFWGITDMVFTPKVIANDDYYKLPNTFNTHQLNNNSIIYTHTMYVKQLFNILELFISGNAIVISHNSDVNVDDSFKVPACVKKWFTTNVNVINPKIESIPIGLENDKWFPKLHKKDQMEWRLGQKREYKNLVYVNHNVKTNPKKRQIPYDILSEKSWATVENRPNGVGFAEYINNVYNHKFVVCPEGNGIDTHRVWETLYMGNIPIVTNSNRIYARFLWKNFEKKNGQIIELGALPFLIIEDWWEFPSEEGLNDFYNFWQTEGIMYKELLTFEYWKNKILKEKE